MKNNIVFKFVAILLCTLTLLGSLGSAAGLYVMSEADLYNKTAEQVREELIWERGKTFAHEASLAYASQALGGCPEGMTRSYYGDYWQTSLFRSGHYAYRILDEEGNAVFSQGEVSTGETYSFPVEGQYLHLVSQETEQDIALREAQARADRYSLTASVEGVEIPAEGLMVSYASFVDANGALVMELYEENGIVTRTRYIDGDIHITHIDNTNVGYLMYTHNGHLVFHSGAVYPNERLDVPVMEANFVAPGNAQLKLRDENAGVGNLFIDDQGTLFFVSQSPMTQDREETAAPEPPALTIDPTPGLMAINNSIPQEGASVAFAVFYGPDGTVLFQDYEAEGLGYLYYNQEGGLNFVLGTRHSYKESYLESLKSAVIAGVYFQDVEGTMTYQATGVDGVGTVDVTGSRLMWQSKPAMTAPVEETQPEETGETALTEEGAEETGEETSEENQEEGAEEQSEEHSEEQSEETQWEEEQSSASDIPEEQPEPQEENQEEPEHPEEQHSEEEQQEGEAEEGSVPVTEETQAPTETTVPPTEAPTEPTEETWMPTEPVIINGKTLDEYQTAKLEYFDGETNQNVFATYVRVPMPKYTVELVLDSEALQYENLYTIMTILRNNRKLLLPALAICLLGFAMTAVYLCTAAGRKPKSDEIRAGGLNRLPLDLYFGLGFGLATFAGITGVKALERLNWNLVFNATLALGTALAICLIIVAFSFAVAAQMKMPGGFWYRNALIGRCAMILVRFSLWLEYFMVDKIFPFLGRLLKKCWKLIKLALIESYRVSEMLLTGALRLFGRFCRWLWGIAHRFLSLLPITWQWLLAGCIILFISALTMNSYNAIAVLLGMVVIVAVIVYGAHCFGVLAESTRNMSKGDLETKVDDKLLLGSFKDFAGDLNALADVAVVAAQKQLKSERMKTELITNVSHDIKTPLTSIINYVDLLQKPHTEAEQEQYLEVLDRQSQRLKKLVDDLMEMSKASTGNMAVEITTVDAVESVNQALGEFSDKLNAAGLMPVFRHTEEQVPMRADGKLVWRVLSNLLGNAVKYAMPGTRLYIDLMELEGKVVLSLKNISREELNVDAEELMERFVRGDDSRNTEGSGLGLNIAKSLMELQKGQLQLLVDGDLFKVTLIFPGA